MAAILVLSPVQRASASSSTVSLWGTISESACTGAEVKRFSDVIFPGTNQPWNHQRVTAVSARESGTISVGVNFGQFNLGYSPSPSCQKEYPVNVNSIAVHLTHYKWLGTQWGQCGATGDYESPYGSFWATNKNVASSLSDSHFQYCGSGWYYTIATAYVNFGDGWKPSFGGNDNWAFADPYPYYGAQAA